MFFTQELGVSPEQINGETTGALGIPEFGTKFVRSMLKSVQVKSFGDLISISGLSHGTDVWTNNAEQLIKNQGLKLHDLVSCRDDIMNYLNCSANWRVHRFHYHGTSAQRSFN
ncbi:hypothetical protein [Mycoplasma sp. ATU-Cv-508]|uniref:hypothetical protein n=1 Tax=Mycoplasma sp. ATU-Cv-508 TaxID=2048001 RepID=UPI000FDEA91A